MVPPVRRAYNQLKMKVRALPTWRKPVGEGAKRTRGLGDDDCLRGVRHEQVELWMVRAAGKHRQARGKRPRRAWAQQECENQTPCT